ncbi:aminoglycoside phosphotransferase family protein [Azohydromonas aeria]|uniref:aminoglycoside phosphotransferase family protein n=1 Tax=Azohydromonas aeria TaxID=2590212 RepID=UPI0012F9A785|nr:phosphotransferase [Azohydromonas aeria]
MTASTISWTDPARAQAFNAWLAPLAAQHALLPHTLRPASSDASFRRYFRIDGADGGPSRIVMDAPPPQEDVRPFVHVAGLIERAGLHGPQLLAADEAHGFLLLSDLGQELYLDALRQADAARADALMRQAIATLVQWQVRVDASTLPAYDGALLQRELALFPEWCVQREFGIAWTDAQQAQWERIAALLTASALAQPRVAVHRDWMPRNLMVSPGGPGILDFQDAVRGPVTYDIASLLRDAFISWDEEQEIDWAVRYWQAAREAGVPLDGGLKEDFGEFWRALEYMGLQRHLKVLGIFCRLKHRDGKAGYAADLPRFFQYATKVALRYRQLQPLLPLLEPLSGASVDAGYTF